MILKPYPQYKDSDVPWLGKIPQHWEVHRFKYLLREVNTRSSDGQEQLLSVSQYTGVTPRRSRNGGDEPDTRAASLVGYKRVSPNDLVVNIMLAWNGSLGVARSAGIVSPAYCVYRFNDRAEPWYYHNLLRLPLYKGRIKADSTGVVESRLRLYSDDLFRIEAPVPRREEQVAIARFVDTFGRQVDRLIHAKRRLIELLNEQKQVIIHQAVTRGLDPNVRLKPSGIDWLPEIPEQWISVRAETLALSLQTGPFGSQLHAYDYKPNGIPVINPSHMQRGRITADLDCAIGPDKAAELSRHRLRPGDIVFARRGELGRCALVGEREAGWLCGTGSLRMRLKDQVAEPEYLIQLFLSKGVAEWLSLQSVGSTMENLNTGILARLPLPFPPKEEQQTIVGHLVEQQAVVDAATDRARRGIDLLREYRTRLVADVVTGKLDVREAAARLPEEAVPDTAEDDTDWSDDDAQLVEAED